MSFVSTYSRRGDSQSGFSLIEVGVSMAVLAVLLTLAVPSFRSWIMNAQLRTTADSLSSGLQLARSEAVRRNAQSTLTLDGTTWTVAVGGAPVQTNPGDGSGKTQISASQNALTFDGVGWVTPLPATDITFDISNPSGGVCATAGGPMRCMRIAVSAGGQIRMCDPAASASQATAC